MTVFRGAMCAALLACAALPAQAQPGGNPPMPATVSEFETVSLTLYGPCSRGALGDAAAAAATEAVCAKLVADLDTVKQAAGASVTPHDLNIYNLLKSTGMLRIARAYLVQDDNTRTARVCAMVEQAWSHAARVDLSVSPAEYATLTTAMLADVPNTARACRMEFEAPAGAPPLPQ